jgi:hypothetical protein
VADLDPEAVERLSAKLHGRPTGSALTPEDR